MWIKIHVLAKKSWDESETLPHHAGAPSPDGGAESKRASHAFSVDVTRLTNGPKTSPPRSHKPKNGANQKQAERGGTNKENAEKSSPELRKPAPSNETK